MSASIREPSLSVPAIERLRIIIAPNRNILRATSIHVRLLFPRASLVPSSFLSGED